jgi:quinol monooxygenase YgiN
MPEELDIIARFHARPGCENGVEAALRAVSAPTRAEAGCIGYQVVRGMRDPSLFFIHSRWKDEAAFEHHATLPHTMKFLAAVELLIDHPLDVARTREII